jgi:hypothetical protein
MKTTIVILALLSAFFSPVLLKAQAYDGQNENKVYLGYTNIGGGSGIELRADHGRGDIFSMGFNVTYLFYKIPSIGEYDSYDKVDYILENFDVGMLMNFHLSAPLHMDEKIDPYVGIFLNLKSAGLHGGCKYNFSERLGVYAQLAQSFTTSLTGPVTNTGNDTRYGKNTILSAGITFNIF